MDSAMVYRGLDIGTAKPSAALRAHVPHHLIDILDPSEAYSAGRFARDAAAAISAIAARGRLPLLVGGTLLYLRALRDGLASLPRADESVRRQLDAEAAATSWAIQHDRLRAVDPEAAARIAPTDRQRIQRALEVYVLTGQPLSQLQREAKAAPIVHGANDCARSGATRGSWRAHRAPLRCHGRGGPGRGSGAVARTR